MIHVYCDIQNTFDILSDEEVKKLIELLNKLDTDYVKFSFISSANINYVMMYVNRLEKFINGKVHMGLHFGYDKYINEKKEIHNITCGYMKKDKIEYYLEPNTKEIIYIDDHPDCNKIEGIKFTLIKKENERDFAIKGLEKKLNI